MAATHTVKQGECLSSIAKKYGFADWRTIYTHPQNAEFKQKRPNPNLIYPGDQIFIPDKKQKQADSGTEKTNKFKLKSQPTFLRVVLQDEEGQPFSEKKYKLKVGDKTFEGTTGGDGLVEQKIPAEAEQGELTAWLDDDSEEGDTWSLKIGNLDPVEEITGVQARLNNLGFNCGEVDGELGHRTKGALKAFQAHVGLDQTGEIDETTRNKLREKHDGA